MYKIEFNARVNSLEGIMQCRLHCGKKKIDAKVTTKTRHSFVKLKQYTFTKLKGRVTLLKLA